MKCRNCSQKHTVYRCYELLNEKDPAKIKLKIQEKLCLICLRPKHDGACNDKVTPFICPTHKEHQVICKCSASNWNKPRIQQNATHVVNR